MSEYKARHADLGRALRIHAEGARREEATVEAASRPLVVVGSTTVAERANSWAMQQRGREHVVIVGGGFGGLTAARELVRHPHLSITIIDRENHHLFQPLLYQVATAGLSPALITMPIRSIFARYPNVRVIMGEVVDTDLGAKNVTLGSGETIDYDWLVVAAGAKTGWFGHDEWARHAVGLKNLRDALTIRERVLMAFEEAEREPDPELRKELLTFVVIGGGPTGVEMAGSISELSRYTLRRDFRVVDPTSIRVILVEMADRVLTPFDEKLSARAKEQLEELGVEVWTGRKVTRIEEGAVEVDGARIDAPVIVWASGIAPVRLARKLGAPLERGRVAVEPDCAIPDHPEAFAIGDIMYMADDEGQPLPGMAPVAIQQAKHVARIIAKRVPKGERRRFHYVDKGIMATIGRSRAVVETKGLKLSGYLAWLAWLFIHLVLLIGFKNRLTVLFNWFWSYITFRRGARLIARTAEPPGRTLEKELRERRASEHPRVASEEHPVAAASEG